MAPRKTKTETTAVDPDQRPDNAAAETFNDLAALPTEIPPALKEVLVAAITNMVSSDLLNRRKADEEREVRFEVAKTVWPVVVKHGADQHLGGRIQGDDENEAGACARIAFEYADAFIAYSRKGGRDGEA